MHQAQVQMALTAHLNPVPSRAAICHCGQTCNSYSRWQRLQECCTSAAQAGVRWGRCGNLAMQMHIQLLPKCRIERAALGAWQLSMYILNHKSWHLSRVCPMQQGLQRRPVRQLRAARSAGGRGSWHDLSSASATTCMRPSCGRCVRVRQSSNSSSLRCVGQCNTLQT